MWHSPKSKANPNSADTWRRLLCMWPSSHFLLGPEMSQRRCVEICGTLPVKFTLDSPAISHPFGDCYTLYTTLPLPLPQILHQSWGVVYQSHLTPRHPSLAPKSNGWPSFPNLNCHKTKGRFTNISDYSTNTNCVVLLCLCYVMQCNAMQCNVCNGMVCMYVHMCIIYIMIYIYILCVYVYIIIYIHTYGCTYVPFYPHFSW